MINRRNLLVSALSSLPVIGFSNNLFGKQDDKIPEVKLDLVSKWETRGMLTGLDDSKKNKCAQLMENQFFAFKNSGKYEHPVEAFRWCQENWKRISVSVARRVFNFVDFEVCPFPTGDWVNVQTYNFECMSLLFNKIPSSLDEETEFVDKISKNAARCIDGYVSKDPFVSGRRHMGCRLFCISNGVIMVKYSC